MRWTQFLVPVKSMDADEIRAFMDAHPLTDLTVLDVRQLSEYETGHLPGAKLIPLPELPDRLAEIDPNKHTIVY